MKWIGFGLADALTKTTAHFFPCADGSAVPYPADCKITIFGEGHQGISVALEGSRVGQPDGVRMEDAFPAIRDGGSGVFGIEINISTIQPKISLAPSLAMIEMNSKGSTIRYWPVMQQVELGAEGASHTSSGGHSTLALLRDAYLTPALFVVNARSQNWSGDWKLARAGTNDLEALNFPEIGPRSVFEYGFDSKVFYQAQGIECNWGLARGRILVPPPEFPPGVVAFLLQRDSKTKRLMSVSAI